MDKGEAAAAVLVDKGEAEALDLPPGFRFHPTDEEIITCYLTEKVLNSSFSATAIGEADFNKCEPWDFPKRARMGEKEWYFFCQRDRKYPTGTRTNRATESGYWKATGKDREIYRGKDNLVGMKKTLVFYRGRAPKGEKTGWVMHEFRLEGQFATYNLPRAAKDEWAVCKIFHKNTDVKKIPELLRINSLSDHLVDYSSSLPPLMEHPSFTNADHPGYSDCGREFKDQPSSDSYYYPHFTANNQTTVMKVEQQDYRNYEMMTMIPSYCTGDASHNPLSRGTIQNNPSLWAEQNNVVMSDYRNRDVMGGGVKNETVSWGMDKQCNMEHSSMVSASQDTGGVSNDRNAETSSAVSSRRDILGRNKAVYEDDFPLHKPPSLGSFPDLGCLWDDY
ncbi:hypothetical protein K1719_027074 [Acacia pycnantha]|nr:hypothetical protein K1719_027074 [Acacia pycnantha]